MDKAKFELDGREYEGYSRGERWNGFAVPYFTREVAEGIVADFHMGDDVDLDGIGWYYDVDGAYCELFPVGGFEWAWRDATA